MAYQIDKDVPLPPTPGVGRKLKYPLDKLQPGESFVTDVNAVRYAAYRYGKRHDMVFPSKRNPRLNIAAGVGVSNDRRRVNTLEAK